MDDPERYQSEFDAIMRTTETLETRAKHLRGVENITDLVEAAKRVGINSATAWKIIEKDPTSPRVGILALIDEVRKQSR